MATDDTDAIFEDAGKAWNVHPALLRAVAGQESGGTRNPDQALSPKGAQGRMQLMPGTAKEMGVTDPSDTAQNIFGGAKYLSQMMDRYGRPDIALAAYNAGPGRVDDYLAGKASLPAETAAYVPGVLRRVQAQVQQPSGQQPPQQGLAPSPVTPGPAAAGQPAADPYAAAVTPAPTPAPDPYAAALAPDAPAPPPASAAAPGAQPAAPDPYAAAFDPVPPAAPAGPDPTFMQRFGTNLASAGAGAVRGLRDVIDKPAALLGSGADALGLSSGQGAEITAGNVAERDAYDKQYGDSYAAGVGRLAGQMVVAAPVVRGAGRVLGVAGDALGAVAGRVAPALGGAVGTAANALAGTYGAGGSGITNFLLRGGSLAANGALQGGATGALASGQSDASVASQAGMGAIVGGVAGPVLAGAGAGIRGAYNFLTGNGATAVPEVAQLAQLARDKYGIPVTAPQIADNSLLRTVSNQSSKLPFGGGGGLGETQQTTLNRAVLSELGETADRVSPAVMSSAAQRIGGVFNGVAARTNIQADPQFLQSLARVGGDAQQVLPQAEQGPIISQIRNLVQTVQQGNGTISGDAYQALTRAGAPLERAESSNNPNIAYYAGQVRNALDDAFARSAAPADQAALQQARGQYRAMRTIDGIAAKSTDGNIAPGQLMQAVASSSRRFDGPTSGVAYTGGGNLGELARIGQQFLAPTPATSGAARAVVGGLLAAGQGGLGSAAALGAVNPLAAGVAAASVPAGLVANRLTGAYLRSDGLANRVIQSSLNPGVNMLTGPTPYAAPVGAAGYNLLLGGPGSRPPQPPPPMPR